MKTHAPLTIALALLLPWATACSTIITGGRKEVNFRSDPPGAHVSITDEKGVTLYEGTTPTVVTLRTGKPYFVGRTYQVQLAKDGFESKTVTLKSTMSGWYFGNFIFGGLVGLLIVDPLTGAMYTLPKEQAVTLVPASATSAVLPEPALHFTGIGDVPESLRPKLIPVN
ncbi:MAG: hypothetical protein L0Z50_04605 [Verrucomicrobiales bacterium]|nr:hypothetical protein [Verrucomicrobiales bacterium]